MTTGLPVAMIRGSFLFHLCLVSALLAPPTSPFLCEAAPGERAAIRLLRRKHDPYGAPRPAPDQVNVPLETSFYVELALRGDGGSTDRILPESVSLALEPEGGEPVEVLRRGLRFDPGHPGRLFTARDNRAGRKLVVYVDSRVPLRPSTSYRARVRAISRDGAELPTRAGTWRFRTEASPGTHEVSFRLRLESPPVVWKGAFFSGFCKPSFSTSASNRIPGYELMDRVRASSPRAWSLQRDFWMTGMEAAPSFLSPMLPNVVRERETRRIVSIETQGEESVLHVEDFYGHEQYGVESGRPPGSDYHPGDEVLIADDRQDARAKVLAVDDARGTVRVTAVADPDAGWRTAYSAPLRADEDPNAPGRFPPGGCYLRKFRPAGTPVYYWGRLDREWDLAHRRFRRRLLPNFADAPGDLSVDGRNWTTTKDYVQLHEVVRAITGHIIDRYGDAALEFPWSVFNEPDLGRLFWRSDWRELQKFYDYTVDGVLRAFEDRGKDSAKVFIGGLELGAIFGTHLKLGAFLAHCSPRDVASGEDTLRLNAAFADPRLAGRRSRRVEQLCRENEGRGSPCDFVSIHAYNTSSLMAAKLARAKEMALEIDPEYYADLWINSHESCPGWNMPPDPAFGDSYLGNGYFPTWCADVARRQLARAAEDPRFAFGETILTFWPWPNTNFGGGNACTRVIHVDDTGDGNTDRTVTVAMPILHFLGLLNGMGSEFRVLPEQVLGGHVVSGFAARADDRLRVLLYSHSALDTESRSGQAFDGRLEVTGWKEGGAADVRVTRYRFDRDHNSYYRRGRSLRERRIAESENPGATTLERIDGALRMLESGEVENQIRGLRQLADLGPLAKTAGNSMATLLQESKSDRLRREAMATLMKINRPRPYGPQILRQLEELSALTVTGRSVHRVDPGGRLELRVPVAANGANFLVIEEVEP